ncbi:MAG: hypothetical protein Q4G46_14460 [Propionibacteriaceae bacterium]|nr:hypothetical protein [Propionibacteriaceae bacterium]
MAPASESVSSPTASADPTLSTDPTVEPSPEPVLEPAAVRAELPQDPAKAGALFPDGTKVAVVGVRPVHKSRGLAKTGY